MRYNRQIYTFTKKQKELFRRFIREKHNYLIYDFHTELTRNSVLVNDPKMYFSSEAVKKEFLDRIVPLETSEKSFFKGSWVVLEELKEVYHLPEQEDLLQLRTVRNRNIVTKTEQLKLYNKKIGIIGLSVGSNLLISLVRYGIGNTFKLADSDMVDVHNLNRTNFLLSDVGEYKIDLVARQMLKIDPYLELELLKKRITVDIVEEFVKDLDLIIDSFDDFPTKIALRQIARKFKIPVISGFDISKGAMIISERYDIEENVDESVFLNKADKNDLLNFRNLTPQDKTKMFISLVGKENHDERMLDSVMQVGKKLSGYPQLNIATNLVSALWLLEIEQIFINPSKGKSFRKYVSLEDLLYKGNP